MAFSGRRNLYDKHRAYATKCISEPAQDPSLESLHVDLDEVGAIRSDRSQIRVALFNLNEIGGMRSSLSVFCDQGALSQVGFGRAMVLKHFGPGAKCARVNAD